MTTGGRANFRKQGDWNCICQVCGQKWKSSFIKQRWDGAMVCPNDFELRNPQEFAKAIPDPQPVPFTLPAPQQVYVGPACTPEGMSAIPGLSVPGCMIPGLVPELF